MEYDRVTTILGYFLEPELVDWKIRVGKREANRISRAATKIGTRVHELIEGDWKKEIIKFKARDPVEVKNAINAWCEFKDHYDVDVSVMELEVQSKELGVVGHIDCICDINGRPTVLDFKTSSKINPKYWLQVNTYAYLLNETDDIDVAILRLDKNLGTYHFEKMSYDPSYVDVFEGMLLAYRYMTQNKHQKEVANGDSGETKTKDSSTYPEI